MELNGGQKVMILITKAEMATAMHEGMRRYGGGG
jgi:hypothetical protein